MKCVARHDGVGAGWGGWLAGGLGGWCGFAGGDFELLAGMDEGGRGEVIELCEGFDANAVDAGDAGDAIAGFHGVAGGF